MNLKQAFQYQRKLEDLLHQAKNELQNPNNAYNIEEIPISEGFSEYNIKTDAVVSVDNIMLFIVDLINERENLCEAINKAKSKIDFDIDACLSSNKFRHQALQSVRCLMKKTDKTEKASRKIYKTNINFEQVPFMYDVNLVYHEAYDREKCKEIYDSIVSKSDELSYKIDAALSNTEIEFTPRYNITDDLLDII